MDERETDGVEFDNLKDPYNHMMRLLFTRWKPFLLRAIYFDEVSRFSDFYKGLPITQKVLSQNLRALECDGLIHREVLPEIPPQVEYHLTDKGRSLIPLLDMVYEWGWHDMKEKNMPIDSLGEMWHGFRERDEKLMYAPYKKVNRDY